MEILDEAIDKFVRANGKLPDTVFVPNPLWDLVKNHANFDTRSNAFVVTVEHHKVKIRIGGGSLFCT